MTAREAYRDARQHAFDARAAACQAAQRGDGAEASLLTTEAAKWDQIAQDWMGRLDEPPPSADDYSLTLGSTMHLSERYAGLWNALKAAEDLWRMNCPIFIYDQMGVAAVVGTDCRAEIYDRDLRRAVLRQPGFDRLRIL